MITKQTKIREVLEKYGNKAAEILIKQGLHCIGCPGAQQESLEQGCIMHGLSDEAIKKIVKELRQLDKEPPQKE